APGHRHHRRRGRRHHPQPGPLLAVRHGHPHVHLLRGLDPGRTAPEEVTRAVAAVVSVLVVVAGAIYLARPKGSGPDPKRWETKAHAAFKPVVDDLPGLLQGVRDWRAGQRPTEELRADLERDGRDFITTRDRVAALDPTPKAPQTKLLYERTAELYVETARAYQVMTDTPAGDLRTQVELLARRLRLLADRVFD